MGVRPIAIARGPIDARLEAVPSKSVTHRALVAAALARGTTILQGPLVADDTVVTRDGLRALGVPILERPAMWEVSGTGGVVPGGGRLSLAESGTSLRFLMAVAALGARSSRLDGGAQLRERPIDELIHALVSLGSGIEAETSAGGLPLRIGGRPLHGGSVVLRAERSSQLASALLLIASRLPGGLDLTLVPPAVSLPYVDLTIRVLTDFGVEVVPVGPLRWRVRPTESLGCEYRIEGDHSSASYFLAAAVIVGGRVRIDGLAASSAQPDARLGDWLHRIGCRVTRGPDWIEVSGTGRIPGFSFNLSETPDLAPTLAVLALFAEGRSTLDGIAHLRYKESDRLDVLVRNLTALGRPAVATRDRLEVGDAAPLHGARIHTASDHRMAMSFALAGLRIPGVILDDADCVSKSNPRFWDQFAQIER